jgi:hypothetical protein
MKLKKLLSIFSVLAVVSLSGCDSITSLNTFPLNLPINVELSLAGNVTSVNKSGGICLDTSQTYIKYKDKIQSITFLAASFRTISATPSTMTGNVTLTLANGSGSTLFTKALGVIKPSDYLVNSYNLSFTENEIDAVNAYIAITGNRCFTATVSATGLPGGSNQELIVSLDMVFESTTKF